MKSLEIDASQGKLRYHDRQGNGPPLIFVHGLGCTSSGDYLTVAADPALAGRRLLLIDLLGSGFSDRPLDFEYTIDTHAETMVELVRKLGLDSFDLFGHSMGGAIAISVASRLADQIRHLIVGEPNLDPGGGLFSRRIAEMSEDDYVNYGHREMVETSIVEGNDIWAASLSISSPHAVHRSATSLVSGSAPTWREQLYALSAIKTAIFGCNSLPDPDVDALSAHGIRIETVAGAGHSMALENPQGLAEAIRLGLESGNSSKLSDVR